METTGRLAVLLRGLEQISRGERVEAWREVRRAIDTAPRDGLVCVLAARLLYLLGDHRAALDAAQAAGELGVESAAMLRYEQARAIGWYHGACTALEDVLRTGAAPCAPPRPGSPGRSPRRRFDQALQHLVQLYVDHHHNEAAATTLERYLPLTSGSLRISLQAARVYAGRGEPDKAVAVVRDALATAPPTPSTWLEAALILLDLGAFDDAAAIYESLLEDGAAAPLALEALGRLCLWTGDVEGAEAYAERLYASETTKRAGPRMRAAAMVLRGDYAGALPMLDAALRDNPDDGEAYVWRAEAHLRLGHKDETCADADRSLQHDYSFAACAIRMLAALVSPDDRRGSDDAASGVAGAIRRQVARWRPDRGPGTQPMGYGALQHAREELSAELTAMFADAPTLLASDTNDGLASLLERSVVAMRGNRTALGTWMKADGQLARLPETISPRITSRMALERLRVAPPEECFRRLDELAARFPDSSMPLVHRGELQLWLGRYAEARADLDAAIAIRRQTRWAWYGLAWLDLIAGDAERSLATCAYGIRVMDNSEGPVALICRGEAYRLLGRLDEAREQLQRACALHPTRLSAWINLALVQSAAREHSAQRAIFRRVAEVAPALVSEAAFALGEDVFRAVVLEPSPGAERSAGGPGCELIDRVLLQSLTMMRGNRASGLITYFTVDGQIRHVPRHSGGSADAEARALAEVRAVLTRALETRRA